MKVILLWLAMLTVTFGQGTLDQSQPLIDAEISIAIGGGTGQKLAQIITAGASGSLTAVGLPLAGTGNLIVQIQGVNGSSPNGTAMLSQTFNGAEFPDFYTDPTGFRILVFSHPISIQAGNRFALVLSVPSSGTGENAFGLISGPKGNPYLRGDGAYAELPNLNNWMPLGLQYDIPFQTFVQTVPEPGTIALLLFGTLFIKRPFKVMSKLR